MAPFLMGNAHSGNRDHLKLLLFALDEKQLFQESFCQLHTQQ
jgi:hypothetical protein